ncbi:DUF488 family protein [Endozoicomonas elysicola]|uniref:DUF488 domain-containing protein n=1 Tax=Endozoicomonas elysicola TaxID=305900 RepID=A0A081K9F7_9GAMM|nr:DUF488 domain-containing protein [Endozoicomonas elysicola]KEI70783.1 hypothetical protein GV64_08520 [Endozoicomonas elysicola]
MGKIYTIGFTQKKAKEFFSLINHEDIKTLIDVRLNNVSQLSGFAKRDDLKFFLEKLCGVDYEHAPELAPTKDLLNAYKKKEISWEAYEDRFLNLMSQRCIEKTLSSALMDSGCLLCSEHKPHFCHRRLVVEYLNDNSELNLQVKHLF